MVMTQVETELSQAILTGSVTAVSVEVEKNNEPAGAISIPIK